MRERCWARALRQSQEKKIEGSNEKAFRLDRKAFSNTIDESSYFAWDNLFVFEAVAAVAVLIILFIIELVLVVFSVIELVLVILFVVKLVVFSVIELILVVIF